MIEIIRAIKKACGTEFILSVRLNGTELMDEYDGNTDDECVVFMEMAQDAGADLLSMVIGWHESRSGGLGRDVPYDGLAPPGGQGKEAVKDPISFWAEVG